MQVQKYRLIQHENSHYCLVTIKYVDSLKTIQSSVTIATVAVLSQPLFSYQITVQTVTTLDVSDSSGVLENV